VLLNEFQPIAAIAPNLRAARAFQPLWESAKVALWLPTEQATPLASVAPTLALHPYSGSIQDQLPDLWRSHRALVFGLATGAVVRLIAPLLQNKATDPAVVVIDGNGKFVISLCGGHQGGADRLARAIAHLIGATPVLTGAANALGLPGVDVLGEPYGWQRGAGDWTGVSAAIAQGHPIQVHQSAGSTLWHAALPDPHPFHLDPIPNPAAHLHITAHLPESSAPPTPAMATKSAAPPTAAWHPKVLWVGMGCERGTSQALLEAALQQVFAEHQLSLGAIAGVATLDLKADEVGLLALCGLSENSETTVPRFPLHCFAAAELREVAVPNPSAVVAAEVGTPSVAEAAALLASHRAGASLDRAADPAALAKQAAPNLLVPKQVIRQPGEPGAVTIAVAQAAREVTQRLGHLWLVGMGPGSLEQMTPAAQMAIAQADVVIGYGLYVDLIRPLLRPGQPVETSPITQERQRAERAIALAQWGLSVAVVSSGDCGIYGMAGLVFEQLRQQNWDGQTPEVQVFPGITALQAAASRVGAPLMHDFCAISLSDLLTPWPQIEKRLTAAAQADFVTALYNPRSRNRVEQLAIAQTLFLAHRNPQTPVAIVRSAYRPDEAITLSTLAQFLDHPVDMLTTVLIGNQTTRFHHQWMITPRGYLGFSEKP